VSGGDLAACHAPKQQELQHHGGHAVEKTRAEPAFQIFPERPRVHDECLRPRVKLAFCRGKQELDPLRLQEAPILL
jgi:hypothetical protein